MKNNSKLVILTTLGIFILCFIPTVAASEGRVRERPLEDWLQPNWEAYPWGEQNWAFGDFVSPYNWLVCKMGLPWPKAPWYDPEGNLIFANDMIYENSLVEGDTIIEGSIKERALNDGTALITLFLDVKNAPLTVYDFFEFIFYCRGWAPEPEPILGAEIDGYMNYKLELKFIITEPGADLPFINLMWFNYISCNIIGTGYGILTEHAVELGYAKNAGALGMVKLHQICLFKPDLPDTIPKYDPIYGDLWPIETIEIHQIS
jgi:hypothetical protein